MGYFQLIDNPDLAAWIALKSSRVFLSSSPSVDGHVLMQHLKRSMPLVFLGSQTPILSSFMPWWLGWPWLCTLCFNNPRVAVLSAGCQIIYTPSVPPHPWASQPCSMAAVCLAGGRAWLPNPSVVLLPFDPLLPQLHWNCSSLWEPGDITEGVGMSLIAEGEMEPLWAGNSSNHVQLPPDWARLCKDLGWESSPRSWAKPSRVWGAPRVCLAAPYEVRVGREMLEAVQGKQMGWVRTRFLSLPHPSGMCSFLYYVLGSLRMGRGQPECLV